MGSFASQRTLVVNFNSPELHQLALALAANGDLSAYVRTYANKGRAWERALSALPYAGAAYNGTFGRRRIDDPRLAALTHEAGVLPDMAAAAIGRAKLIDPDTRHRMATRLYMSVRQSVASEACRHVADASCVVGYEGFALPAFDRAHALGRRARVLNYPVAHHRQRRIARLEENEREPDFAITWPDFDDWPAGHEERLDEEIRQADAVLVGSSYAADSFVAEGIDRSKMRVVPYGVDLNTFTPGSRLPRKPSDPFKAIYVGQLTQRKGIAYLLRGYRQFARAGTQLTLVGSIVGSDAPLRPYADQFTHIAHQTRPALAAMYRQADVFVFPTLVEGMPLVVLEAMACGLPVIVTANGPGDLVRDGVDGFVVPDRNADVISDRLDRLHRDPDLCVQMARSAALRARSFGWDTYAAKACRALSEASERTNENATFSSAPCAFSP
jgi:glycosyltransferase involved in cell wall biosynthesis